MTTNEAAVEAMARTMYYEFFKTPPNDEDEVIEWESLNAGDRRFWLDDARIAFNTLLAALPTSIVLAVLERMREPTEAMRLAGIAEEGRVHGLAHCASYGLIWRAMVDARLAELAREESDGN